MVTIVLQVLGWLVFLAGTLDTRARELEKSPGLR
jgi:hypothetical protein